MTWEILCLFPSKFQYCVDVNLAMFAIAHEKSITNKFTILSQFKLMISKRYYEERGGENRIRCQDDQNKSLAELAETYGYDFMDKIGIHGANELFKIERLKKRYEKLIQAYRELLVGWVRKREYEPLETKSDTLTINLWEHGIKLDLNDPNGMFFSRKHPLYLLLDTRNDKIEIKDKPDAGKVVIDQSNDPFPFDAGLAMHGYIGIGWYMIGERIAETLFKDKI